MRQITQNAYFRIYICGLSVKKTAELCLKSVKTVEGWDRGRTIPPICKRLMKLYCNKDLDPTCDDWNGWKINKGELITPNGWVLTPDRIVMGNALVEIGAENDKKTRHEILKIARMLKKLPESRASEPPPR
ncbi:DUF3653 domain-containing protein [Photobacterium leiognathi]|uniref:DUF3653 domain-containing protein n=1 Tax=Photobacterium leiognathi TaxID=553611 RepID=UPI002981C78B|nr:DUF3653 domain-containing protein [Photobacterium leiognathi]